MITGTTRLAAVLGWPVTHSRSPQLVNAAFAAVGLDVVMVPIGVAPDALPTVIAGLRAMRVIGASVTVPHKLAVAALCDELAGPAHEIGAVNCLRFEGERMIGHNTDASGYVAALAEAGLAVDGMHVVVLGAGGAARAVVRGLAGAGAFVEVIARSPEAITWAPARAWTEAILRDTFARAALVIDATPIGLGGADELAWVEALPLDALRPGACVSTLVYHRTPILLERARARGHATLDGRAMLVHQAAHAFTLWTGEVAPIDVMTRALATALAGT